MLFASSASNDCECTNTLLGGRSYEYTRLHSDDIGGRSGVWTLWWRESDQRGARRFKRAVSAQSQGLIVIPFYAVP